MMLVIHNFVELRQSCIIGPVNKNLLCDGFESFFKPLILRVWENLDTVVEVALIFKIFLGDDPIAQRR
jgi:hypothetical protein